MDVREYIQAQITVVRRNIDSAMQDITEDQFNWPPPGTANPISASFLHAVSGEDFFIHGIIQGKPLLWETQGWGPKIGLVMPPGGGRGWDEIKKAKLLLGPVMEYQQAVRAETDAYVANLTTEELDRKVKFFDGDRPVGGVLAVLAAHTTMHGGEIAAIRGIQGFKGLPF